MSPRNEGLLPVAQPKKRETVACLESTRKKKGENKKSRFNEKQVQLLETMFQAEAKIEPMKKVQLAKELGLQPRQVAIWFQNKRARWKSKQLEKEYRILRANYENLMSQFESLKDEKQSLCTKLQNLNLALQELEGSKISYESQNKDTVCMYGRPQPERLDERYMASVMMEDDDYREQTEYTPHGIILPEYLNIDDIVDSSQASTDQEWCRVDATQPYNQYCSQTQWWDFWNC